MMPGREHLDHFHLRNKSLVDSMCVIVIAGRFLRQQSYPHGKTHIRS